MEYIQVKDNATEHTKSKSCVFVEANKVYQLSDDYRDITSKDQLDRIIDSLVIDKGFLLDSHVDGMLTLTSPTDKEVVYWIWTKPDFLGVNKRTTRYVGNLQ